MNKTFKPERQKNPNSYNLKNTKAIMTNFLPWLGLRGRSRVSPSKSKMAIRAHIEFRKMRLSVRYYMEIFAQNSVQWCSMTKHRCPCDQKQNRKLIRMTGQQLQDDFQPRCSRERWRRLQILVSHSVCLTILYNALTGTWSSYSCHVQCCSLHAISNWLSVRWRPMIIVINSRAVLDENV